MAFIYHAKPRYTKDIDIWVDPSAENLGKVNEALVEFGSPSLLTPNHAEEILQIGVEPDRIDILQRLEGIKFSTAWKNRITDKYGDIISYWIDIDDLIRVKEMIDLQLFRNEPNFLRSGG